MPSDTILKPEARNTRRHRRTLPQGTLGCVYQNSGSHAIPRGHESFSVNTGRRTSDISQLFSCVLRRTGALIFPTFYRRTQIDLFDAPSPSRSRSQSRPSIEAVREELATFRAKLPTIVTLMLQQRQRQHREEGVAGRFRRFQRAEQPITNKLKFSPRYQSAARQDWRLSFALID
jgi:hypothetical protein